MTPPLTPNEPYFPRIGSESKQKTKARYSLLQIILIIFVSVLAVIVILFSALTIDEYLQMTAAWYKKFYTAKPQESMYESCIDKSAAQIFSKLMKFREEADYNPISMFTKEDFVVFKGEAEILAALIKSRLKEGNETGPPAKC